MENPKKSPNLTLEEENSLTFSYDKNAIEELKKFVERNNSQGKK